MQHIAKEIAEIVMHEIENPLPEDITTEKLRYLTNKAKYNENKEEIDTIMQGCLEAAQSGRDSFRHIVNGDIRYVIGFLRSKNIDCRESGIQRAIIVDWSIKEK